VSDGEGTTQPDRTANEGTTQERGERNRKTGGQGEMQEFTKEKTSQMSQLRRASRSKGETSNSSQAPPSSPLSRISRRGPMQRSGIAMSVGETEIEASTRDANKRKSRRPFIEDDEDEEDDEVEQRNTYPKGWGTQNMADDEDEIEDENDPYLSPEGSSTAEERLRNHAHVVDGTTTEEDE